MRRASILLAATLLLGAAPKETRVDAEARGRFDVEMKPLTPADPALGRFSLAKRYHGDLEAAGVGEMLSAGAPAKGAAGYVAIEQVTGVLKGRAGGFALMQSGMMDAGGPRLTVSVVPGSGSGALSGISGTMTIDVAAGHTFVLSYTLPRDP